MSFKQRDLCKYFFLHVRIKTVDRIIIFIIFREIKAYPILFTHYSVRTALLGHASGAQFSISLIVPLQFFPPQAGAGFEQFLVRCLVPFSQLTLHELQSDHCVHFPSTPAPTTKEDKNELASWQTRAGISMLSPQCKNLEEGVLNKYDCFGKVKADFQLVKLRSKFTSNLVKFICYQF